jgi:glutamate racemase
VKIALLDSGIGLLAAAAELRRLRPDADLVLSSDPDGIPWGPRTPGDVTERALACARAAAAYRPDVLIVACNTASVHGLEEIRAELEPAIPVVGTVPAIKPAAAAGGPVAVWATPATTGSPYQNRLISEFADGVTTYQVACPGLADAVDRGDAEATRAAIADAAERTPGDTRALVLGCTHYELVVDGIRAALTGAGREAPVFHSSAPAVAAQALRRAASPSDGGSGGGTLVVLRSGRVEQLPEAALAYPAGRALAGAGQAALVEAERG